MGLSKREKVFSDEWYRKKHTIQIVDENYSGPDLFGKPIVQTRNQYLNDNLIRSAIYDDKNVGAYNKLYARMIALDIDCHGKAKRNKIPQSVIDRFYKLVDTVGLDPSIVFQSTNYGLHVYYFLNQSFPISVILHNFKLILDASGVEGVELLPNHNHSLRCPRDQYQLSVRDLKPIRTEWERITYYSPGEVFWRGGVTKWYMKRLFQRSSKSDINLQTDVSATMYEERFYPIQNGASNDPLCKIVGYYFFLGISVDECAVRFLNLLYRSGYTGDLLNPFTLKYRIRSIFRGCRKNRFTYYEQITELELFDSTFIDSLVDQSPFYKQRHKSMKLFLIRLFSFINYHVELKKSAVDFELYSYVYPGYRKNRNEGMIPIPTVMLKSWNSQYKDIMDYLIEKRVLVMGVDYWYGGSDDEMNRCRYYFVNKMVGITKRDRQTRLDQLRTLVERLGKKQIVNDLGIGIRTLNRWIAGSHEIREDRKGLVDDYIKTNLRD